MTTAMRVLITGGTGFIGRHLVARMGGETKFQITLLTRQDRPVPDGVAGIVPVGDLTRPDLPGDAFAGADLLIHLAGHVSASDPGPVAQSQNVRMAQALAQAARAAGVPRVLVLSSIAATVVARQPHLARRYGREKLEADAVFQGTLAPDQGLIFVRPPAVYGPGMSGALATLAKLMKKGLPVPLGLARAPRNYISVGNLVDALAAIAGADDAAWAAAQGRIFAPADPAPVATNDLVRMMAGALGRSPRLIPVPLGLMRLLGRLTGKAEMISGAIDGLDLADNAPLEEIFGWTPAERMPESLEFLGK